MEKDEVFEDCLSTALYQYLDVWTPDRVDAALTEKCNNV